MILDALIPRWANTPYTIRRRVINLGSLGFIMLVTMMCTTLCGIYGTEEQKLMHANSVTCQCDGTTNVCGDAKFENSFYCNQESLNDMDVCECQGKTLHCEYRICEISYISTKPDGSTGAVPGNALCDQDGIHSSSAVESAQGLHQTETDGKWIVQEFKNSPVCKKSDNAQKPEEPGGDTNLVIKPGACYEECDPDKPLCQQGLSCQERADGTSICYSGEACVSVTAPPGETTCKCDGTTLVCTDGTSAAFNPACGVGGQPGAVPTATDEPPK